MKKYKIHYKLTSYGTDIVEANSRDEAEEKWNEDDIFDMGENEPKIWDIQEIELTK